MFGRVSPTETIGICEPRFVQAGCHHVNTFYFLSPNQQHKSSEGENQKISSAQK